MCSIVFSFYGNALYVCIFMRSALNVRSPHQKDVQKGFDFFSSRFSPNTNKQRENNRMEKSIRKVFSFETNPKRKLHLTVYIVVICLTFFQFFRTIFLYLTGFGGLKF